MKWNEGKKSQHVSIIKGTSSTYTFTIKAMTMHFKRSQKAKNWKIVRITSLRSKERFFCNFFLSFFVYFRDFTFLWFYPHVKFEESSTYKIRHIMKSVYISISTMTGRKRVESLNIWNLSPYLSTRKLKTYIYYIKEA